jgi:hypothetical protein
MPIKSQLSTEKELLNDLNYKGNKQRHINFNSNQQRCSSISIDDKETINLA